MMITHATVASSREEKFPLVGYCSPLQGRKVPASGLL